MGVKLRISSFSWPLLGPFINNWHIQQQQKVLRTLEIGQECTPTKAYWLFSFTQLWRIWNWVLNVFLYDYAHILDLQYCWFTISLIGNIHLRRPWKWVCWNPKEAGACVRRGSTDVSGQSQIHINHLINRQHIAHYHQYSVIIKEF